MKEEDIRPARLKAVSDNLFIKDAKKLLQEVKKFIHVKCPACNVENKKIYFKKLGYSFRLCRGCQTIYISPRPTSALLNQYYSTAQYYKYWMKYIFPISRLARIKNIYKPRVKLVSELIKKYKVPTGILVDIGAGSGDFGKEVDTQKIFREILLVEPGKIQVNVSPTLKVINKVFEEADLPRDINVITCFETLEHLFSPVNFLKLIHARLTKKGIVMLSTVNHRGFDILLLGKKSEYLIGPDHLNIFTTDSIQVLLKKVGFTNIEVSTPGQLDVDLILTAHKQKLIDLKKDAFLNHLLLESNEKVRAEFQEFLKQQKLSSHMLIVAQK